ncbi:MAG TPA: CocE/NonD family hydrolase [Bacteroidales bacterium]|nr:CocE/NonD family hydrolase [Bacteroidales bacterium]
MKKIITYLVMNCVFVINLFSQLLIQPTFVDSAIMRDGKRLAVDIYVPDNGGGNSYPVILVQTPYNRLLFRTYGLPIIGNNIAASAYVMVIADWRCFYGSAAACSGNYDRANDGYDLVEWIAAQPWCNSKVGTWGPSALGRIQYMTARKRPPHLVCAIPLVAGPQYSYAEYYPGGVYRTEYVQQLDALGFGVSSTLLAHQTYDILWSYSEAVNFYPDSINIPVFMIGGWYDHNINVMMDFFAGLRQSSFTAVRDKHRLLIGPWTHGGHGNAGVGGVTQGELTYPGAAGWSDSLALSFFDYYLRSVPNNWNLTPYIQYFQMGENTWQSSADWPPAGVNEHTLYFQNDGGITEVLPVNAGAYRTFLYDPYDPSPTIGGPTLRADLLQGPYDQASQVESRSDILVFTTNVLTDNVIMKGKAQIHLFVSSDRKDTDFAVRLTDVYPDDRSMIISDGIIRMRFRDGYAAADTSLMIPGNVYEANIELPDVAMTFLAGHKIRVDISSSDYPRFDCNLNNGGPMYMAGDTLVPTNRIYVASDYASCIKLPVNGFFTAVAESNGIIVPSFYICPNPAVDFMNVEFTNTPDKNAHMDIYDVNGKNIFSKKYTVGELNKKMLHIPLNGFSEGIYLVTIQTTGEQYSRKVIIKKP